jgi:hypothetical protein
MKYIIMVALLLAGCGPISAFTPQQKAECGGDLGTLRIGLPESTMLKCTFPGYTPYVSASRTSEVGQAKIYEGMSQVRYVVVRDGKVVSWGK